MFSPNKKVIFIESYKDLLGRDLKDVVPIALGWAGTTVHSTRLLKASPAWP